MAKHFNGYCICFGLHAYNRSRTNKKILISKRKRMETSIKTKQQIQLVDGVFSPSEASDVILALINEKINFHKLQRLSWSEGNETANTKYPDDRIKELEKEKEITKSFISRIRTEGKKLKIEGSLQITLED